MGVTDSKQTRAWWTAARTVRRCLLDFLWGTSLLDFLWGTTGNHSGNDIFTTRLPRYAVPRLWDGTATLGTARLFDEAMNDAPAITYAVSGDCGPLSCLSIPVHCSLLLQRRHAVSIVTACSLHRRSSDTGDFWSAAPRSVAVGRCGRCAGGADAVICGVLHGGTRLGET